MWRTVCWLGAALAVVTTGTAEAADAQDRYAAHGLGRVQCKRFVELCEQAADECKLTGTWVGGYLTAFNAVNQDTFDILPWQQPELVAEGAFNLCRQNPEVALVEAVTQVIKVLYPERVTSASERVQIGEGDGRVFLYRDTVRKLQQRLIQTGHLEGGADGVFGPGTKGAVEAFQTSANLPASGVPDQRTLLALFYGSRAQQPGGNGAAPQQSRSPAAAPAPAQAQGQGAAQPAPRLDLNLIPAPQ